MAVGLLLLILAVLGLLCIAALTGLVIWLVSGIRRPASPGGASQ